jgi:hypothetical protein
MLFNKSVIVAFLISISAGFLPSVSAGAFEFGRGREHERRPEIGWHQGRWVHDRHNGRLGWWWVVGPQWNYFLRPTPVYEPRTVIIQEPPQVIVQQPAAQQPQPSPPVVSQSAPVLYYCKATGTFYPDTMTCPGGWMQSVGGAPPMPSTN